MKPTLVTCGVALAVVSAWAVGQGLSDEQVRKRVQTLSNAKQVGTALQLYAVDYDDVLPIGQSTGQVKELVHPYLRSLKVWKSENPGSQLLFNINVAGVSMITFPNVVEVPVLFESKPWADGRRVVGYADGHCKIESSDRWLAIEKALKKKWPKAKPPKKGKNEEKNRLGWPGSGLGLSGGLAAGADR